MTASIDTCAFSIGGLALTLSADDAPLIDEFRGRYHAFRAEPAGGLHVHFDVTPGSVVMDEYPIEFRDGALYFTNPCCAGSVDLTLGRADIRLSVAHPVPAVEYVLRTVVALLAFDAGGLMLHAAGLAHDGHGYAFFGHSGSGKTTVARVSRQAHVLNDDLIVLAPGNDRRADWRADWRIHATPFSNPTQVPPAGPDEAPLTALLRLVQGKQVYVQAMPVAQAAAEILSSVPIIPLDPTRAPRLIDRALNLVTAVPTARLYFLPDDSFWPAIWRAVWHPIDA